MNQSHAPDVAKQADQHRQNGPKATDFSVSCPMKCDKWPNQHVYGCSKRDVSNYDRISELLTSSTHGTIGVSTTSKELQMLIEYIRAAMCQARYEILPDDDTFYGEIPDFPVRGTRMYRRLQPVNQTAKSSEFRQNSELSVAPRRLRVQK